MTTSARRCRTGACGPCCRRSSPPAARPVSSPNAGPDTGNVSVCTSTFALVVLDSPLDDVHTEIDLVATPAGPTVAMVHCNNGADELNRWVSLFKEAASVLGGDRQVAPDEAFAAL